MYENLSPQLLTIQVNFDGLANGHWFHFLPLDNGTKTRHMVSWSWRVGLFKLMVSVENTRMNEALKKEVEAKVPVKLVYNH